jgi:hypothetical protein
MKKHSTNPGKAPAALSQPQPATQVKKKPTPEQIEAAMAFLINDQMDQFALNLSTARAMYKQNRKLVTSPKFPTFYADRYKQSTGQEIGETYVEKAPTEMSLRKELKRTARDVAAGWAPAETHSPLSPAFNLMSESGRALADPPTITYILVANHFDGKDIDALQEVELTYDENWKLRHYLAELRGLIPPPTAA